MAEAGISTERGEDAVERAMLAWEETVAGREALLTARDEAAERDGLLAEALVVEEECFAATDVVEAGCFTAADEAAGIGVTALPEEFGVHVPIPEVTTGMVLSCCREPF